MSDDNPSLLESEEHVLSTLESDGSRRWMFPRLSMGKFWKSRRFVAYALIAFFLLLPWIRIAGQPVVLLDIVHRRFLIAGLTFLPTDTVLLALLVLSAFVSVFFVTAVFGRVFCGWACPHSVYLEWVYRPIERFFMGKVGVGGRPRKDIAGWRYLAMYATFLAISVFLANTFVSYFVGTDQLLAWVWTSPPWAHPVAFGVVLLCSAWIMFDMAYWREQMCIIGCPYGRFQSVMLDRNSLIITYDPQRGEPRGKPRKRKKGQDVELPVIGDCIDCSMCVTVCPTGIDIREGLQLECIGCAQCVDACNDIMDRMDRPRGLIRYSSQEAVEGNKPKLLRPRVVIYPVLLTVLLSLFVTVLVTRSAADLTVLRNPGRPFIMTDAGQVENTMKVKITNRTDEVRRYTVSVPAQPEVVVLVADDVIELEPRETVTESVRFVVPPTLLEAGRLGVEVVVTDDLGNTVSQEVRLLGPAGGGRKKTPGPQSLAPHSRVTQEVDRG